MSRARKNGKFKNLQWPMFEDVAYVPIGGGLRSWQPVVRVAGTQATTREDEDEPFVTGYFLSPEKAMERLTGSEGKSIKFRKKLHEPSAAIDAWLESSASERAEWNPAGTILAGVSDKTLLTAAGLGIAGWLGWRWYHRRQAETAILNTYYGTWFDQLKTKIEEAVPVGTRSGESVWDGKQWVKLTDEQLMAEQGYRKGNAGDLGIWLSKTQGVTVKGVGYGLQIEWKWILPDLPPGVMAAAKLGPPSPESLFQSKAAAMGFVMGTPVKSPNGVYTIDFTPVKQQVPGAGTSGDPWAPLTKAAKLLGTPALAFGAYYVASSILRQSVMVAGAAAVVAGGGYYWWVGKGEPPVTRHMTPVKR